MRKRTDMKIIKKKLDESCYRKNIKEAIDTGEDYWYFTTHGVQPGSVPKGINIKEIKDTPNGSYFLADKMLTTTELRQYDIKEKEPRDLKENSAANKAFICPKCNNKTLYCVEHNVKGNADVDYHEKFVCDECGTMSYSEPQYDGRIEFLPFEQVNLDENLYGEYSNKFKDLIDLEKKENIDALPQLANDLVRYAKEEDLKDLWYRRNYEKVYSSLGGGIEESSDNETLWHQKNLEDTDDDVDGFEWELQKVKVVPDADGFNTQYALYKKLDGTKWITMYGDIDYNPPEEMYADMEFDNEKEAWDFFNDYKGFTEDEIMAQHDKSDMDWEYVPDYDDGF